MMVLFTLFLYFRYPSFMVCFPVLEKRHLIGVFHALQGKVNLVPITEIGLNQKSSFLVIRKVNVAEKLYIIGRKEL